MAPVPAPPRGTPEMDGATYLADRHGRAWAVREMRRGDVGALAAYFESLTAADYANFHPHPLDRATAEGIAAGADSPDALRCLLFAGSGPVAGYGFLWDWDEDVPLLGMSLASHARGRGLGSAFTRHLVARAAAAGKAAVRLTVYRDNVAAFRCYRAAGFEEQSSHPDDWGGAVREEVRMRCALGPAAASRPHGPVARDGEAFALRAGGSFWALSWHGPGAAPDGTPHGANGLCVTADGDVVLISPDGRRWGWPGGRPEGEESWEQTLRREMLEEACATVREARLLGFCRSACLAGPERGLVLVRSIWRARVELLPWAPRFEIAFRRVVPAAQAMAEFWTEKGAKPVYRRAFQEAGLG